MAEKEHNLKKFKEEYEKLRKKHNLPSYNDLNENFHIEKAADEETEQLIREIRKIIGEKIYSYLRLIESLLNPVNVQMFVFSLIKTIKPDKKKKITEIYKKLAKLEIDLISVDLCFSEKKEADFIKKSYEVWKEVKEVFDETLDEVRKNWENKFEANNKAYFD